MNKSHIMEKRAKMVCTIGPASQSEEIMTQLIMAGMDVARLNFSHGTHDEHLKSIEMIRRVSDKLNKPIAILQDLQGPKIRIGKFSDGPVTIQQGDEFTISTKDRPGDSKGVSTTYKNLSNDVSAGDTILINDGLIKLNVKEKNETDVICIVVNGGVLYDHKGINLPGVKISEPSLTKKDEKDLKFGLEHGIDYVALSFVRNAEILREIKKKMGNNVIPVVAKLEKPEALENLDEIIEEADVIMVARGDLGVEILPEKVPVVQKQIIEKCRSAGVPVITATQMLDSMMVNPVPTRAEASDVANAIFDGSDAVMLSGETAFGKYPVESVQMMHRIICEAEKGKYFRLNSDILQREKPDSFSESICHSAAVSARDINARYIVVFTESGYTAKIMSKFRPCVPVLALTRHPKTLRRLALYWGTVPLHMDKKVEVKQGLENLENRLSQDNLISSDDTLVIIAGSMMEEGGTNMMRLHRVK